MGYRDYSVALGKIVDASGKGDFTTITAALAASSSGDVIYIRPGTYTEDFTLSAGVSLLGPNLGPNGSVTIIGKMSFSATGTATIQNLNLQTNSDYILEVTGANASVVQCTNCNFICSDNTGINFTSTSSSSQVLLIGCFGNVSTTGVSFFTCSSDGLLEVQGGVWANTGGSTTPNAFSNGSFFLMSNVRTFVGCFTFSDTSGYNIYYSRISSPSPAVGIAMTGTTVGALFYSRVGDTSGSAITIGTGCTCRVGVIEIGSSNVNALDGAGTIFFGLIIYVATSSNNNVTTQTAFTTQP